MSPDRTVEPSLAESASAKPMSKERGCFQCSRRRIICDKAEPSCGKCIKKDIECSGSNRIRFTVGVARRGKLKDRKVPDINSNAEVRLPTSTAFSVVTWQGEPKRLVKPTEQKRSIIHIRPEVRRWPDAFEEDDDLSALSLIPPNESLCLVTAADDSPSLVWPKQVVTSGFEQDMEDIPRNENCIPQHFSTNVRLQPWITPLSAGARMLFSYFSEAVAPVMVILDTTSNGYRELLLRMALEDEVLRRAVGVVAAQHLARERPQIRNAAEAERAAIISRLRKDSMSATVDQVFNKYTWATLIVLLVGETVTGSEEYSFLVGMLLTLSANSKTESEDPTARRFLRSTTNMFELLGLPLLGEDSGVAAITRASEAWQDWLACEQFPAGSESYVVIDKIRLCFDAACTIYVRRATSEAMTTSMSKRLQYEDLQKSTIQDLIGRISLIPPHSPGAHALVWPCFIAGAESSDPIRRAFVVDYLNSIYALTKFGNIPVAVQSLRNLWANKGDKRWTQYLPEISRVLVM